VSPSARFFSPGEIAAEAPTSAASAAPPTPIPFPDPAVAPSEHPGSASIQPRVDPVRKPESEPFWQERTSSAQQRIPEEPVAQTEPPTSIETLPMAKATASPLPIPEPPGPIPEYPDYRPAPKKKYSWKIQLLRWLFPELVIREPERPRDRRRADRQSLPGLIAYYFTGGSPEPHKISNISVTGFYLHTDERWMPGTVVRMTLQRVGSKGDDPSDTITVNSKIIRWGTDGEGFEFILTDLDE
jgi:hypothetical protein